MLRGRHGHDGMVAGFKKIYNQCYHMYEELEDTKGVIKVRKSTKDRQHNGQNISTYIATKIFR